jgi:hypothetical protein
MDHMRARNMKISTAARAGVASTPLHPLPGPLGERFVLWALRQWRCELDAYERATTATDAAGQGEHGCPDSLLLQGFRIGGLGHALPHFAMAMDAILHGMGRRRLEIRPPRCAFVSDDEATFVALCGLAQAHLDRPLAASLQVWLPPEAASLAAVRLASFAALLETAGLDLAPTPQDGAGWLH